ncbi:MAG: FmdB family zinc ribbon protein [Candidatus Nanopelagicales bacterium]
MPTYEYVCSDCGHELEAVQSFSDDPLTECPACAGSLRKRFGNVGVVFKGSGFYRNDSRGSSDSAKSDTKTDTKADAKSESKSDSTSGSTSGSTTSAKPAPASSTSGTTGGGSSAA